MPADSRDFSATRPQARVFAPASVSNVACGFDVLGFAVDGPGAVVSARASERPGVEITRIEGDRGRLPRSSHRNTAGRAAIEVLARLGVATGVDLEIEKRMPLSSGLGSSAASAVAATIATAEVYGGVLDETELLQCAIVGESLASGAVHADNVAPSFFGGFVLVRSLDPVPDVVSLPVPAGLAVALVRPQLEIDTAPARRALATELPLPIAVAQWANVGALVAALHRGDLELLGRSLCDFVAEPVRSPLVPGFAAARDAAINAGAIGCSLSGSGPTMFALCPNRSVAAAAAEAMASELEAATGPACDIWISKVGAAGARHIDAAPLDEPATGESRSEESTSCAEPVESLQD